MRADKVFISYRREDSAGHTGRLYDQLSRHFGTDQVFIDVDAIDPGEDFTKAINQAVSSCNILLVVIGKQWLNITSHGKRALDNANDFVRIEVAAALERDISVIPVLVQGAAMPPPEELPKPLAKLAFRNAIELSDHRWKYDVDRLVKAIEKVISKTSAAGAEPRPAEVRARPEPPKAVESAPRQQPADEAARGGADFNFSQLESASVSRKGIAGVVGVVGVVGAALLLVAAVGVWVAIGGGGGGEQQSFTSNTSNDANTNYATPFVLTQDGNANGNMSPATQFPTADSATNTGLRGGNTNGSMIGSMTENMNRNMNGNMNGNMNRSVTGNTNWNVNLNRNANTNTFVLPAGNANAGAADSGGARPSGRPITLQGLSNALKINGLSNQELIEHVEARGVTFRLTPESEQQLRDVGARPDLIEAVRRSYRPQP